MMKSQDAEPENDPFLCQCCKCKKFWANHFNKNGVEMLKDPPHLRATRSGCMYASVIHRDNHPAVLKIGDRITVTIHPEQLTGVVKYLGPLDENLVSPKLYVGVHLDKQVGSVHNGIVNSKRYFHCPRGHGLMVKYGDVVRINPPERKPSLKGNYMFPSYKEIKERRKARSLLDPELDLGPMYTANKSSRVSSSRSQRSEQNDGTSKRGRQVMRQQEHEDNQDYATNAPRDLINRWSKEQFGGGRDGEVKARTLYKLHAAYQRGLKYKRAEERGDLTNSDDSSSDDDESETSDRKYYQHSGRKPQSATGRKV